MSVFSIDPKQNNSNMESQNKWSLKMSESLDMEIIHHPPKMRSVVNLIIAMERLKAGMFEFRDEELLSFMRESIIEERVVFETTSAPTQEYIKTEESLCMVNDTENKSLYWVPNNMELNAIILQGGADTCRVHMSMSTYVHPAPPAETQIVALGIRNTNYFLSCHMDGEVPTLRVELVEDKDSLQRISSNSDLKRFLFYKTVTGVNISTLVSVRYSDFYISTALENNRPVELCQDSAPRYRSFVFKRLNKNSGCERQL